MRIGRSIGNGPRGLLPGVVWPVAMLLTLVSVGAAGGGGRGPVSSAALAAASSAAVHIDATHPGRIVDGNLMGSNLLHDVPASDTVDDPDFVVAASRMGLSVLRWPGGNQADVYDWKQDEIAVPGRRIHVDGLVDVARMIRFASQVGAEPTITVNFGTMTAQDAADLVEFLNGPADSVWGAVRAGLGFPAPLGVRFFEIGNEENQPHMWYYSWTAEDPWKYFFGGDEERRGFYGGSRQDPVGAKGDFIAADGEPGQEYTLRFLPARDLHVLWAASTQDAEARVFEEWHEVDRFEDQGADASVFTFSGPGTVRFGDGVHGRIPPAGSYLLVEYTTYGHGGFVDFTRAMRAAPSSVPIRIGAATLPFVDGDPIGDTEAMRGIFEAMDFYVRHQYDAAFPKEWWSDQASRRQIPWERVSLLESVFGRVHGAMEAAGVDRPLSIGVTEWNIFLAQQAWHLDRTLEGGVLAAEWIARVLAAGDAAPVVYAEQFALPGGNLSLIRSQADASVAPMGYVFEGFAPWAGGRLLPVSVDAPKARAYDRDLPLVVAAAVLSADGTSLHAVFINDSVDTPVETFVSIQGFSAGQARLRRLAADAADADNDHGVIAVALEEASLPLPVTTLTLPPHSVSFLDLSGPVSPRSPRTRALPHGRANGAAGR